MTLSEFLEARIAEDEAVAQAVGGLPWEWKRVEEDAYADVEALIRSDGTTAVKTTDADEYQSWLEAPGDNDEDERATDFVAWSAAINPARVLAECEAKRAIIAELDDFANGFVWNSGTSSRAESALMALALPYAAHPDYRQEWKV